MSERLSAAEWQETTEWPPKEVIRAQDVATRSIAAQAERELMRDARTRQTEDANAKAKSTSDITSRLLGKLQSSPSTDNTDDEPASPAVVRAVGTAAVVSIAAVTFAVGGVADALALALSPMVLLVGTLLAAVAYFGRNHFSKLSFLTKTKMTVESVELIRPGLVAVHVEAENIEDFGVQPGQLAEWSFMDGSKTIGSSNGYLSCVPRDGMFRIMFLVDDAASNALRIIPTGSKVVAKAAEGLSADLGHKRKSLLIAGGEGIIPMRALFEAVPGQVTLLYREGRRTDVLLLDELKQIGQYRKARMNIIVGAPNKFPPGRQPLCTEHLAAVAPDIRKIDVYVAGSDRLVSGVVRNLRELGVPKQQIHVERI